MSEANKEQAEQCAELALQAHGLGDIDKAIRLLTKALRLHDLGPAVHAKLSSLIDQKEGRSGNTENSSEEANDRPSPNPRSHAGGSDEPGDSRNAGSSRGTPNPAVRQRAGAGAVPKRTVPAAPPQRPFTPEQAAFAKKVTSAKDFYAVMELGGLEPTLAKRGADLPEDAVRRAYKKLAIKLHPDKNAAPGAEPAFKRLSTAYTVLCDADKRREYDMYGEGGAQGAAMAQQFASSQGGARGRGGMRFDEEVNAEDIFNMMFGGGMGGLGGAMNMRGASMYQDQFGNVRWATTGGGGQRQPRSARAAPAGAEDTGAGARWGQLLQLLPLLLFFLVSLFSFSGGDERLYALQPENEFTQMKKTGHYGIVKDLPFYVRPDFAHRAARDPSLLSRVERNVQQQYYRTWSFGCSAEQNNWGVLVRSAQRGPAHRRAQAEEQLRSWSEPNCDNMRRYFPDDAPPAHQPPWPGAHGPYGAAHGDRAAATGNGAGVGGRRSEEVPFEKVEI